MKRHIVNLSLVALILIAGGCARYDRTEGLPPVRVGTKTPERIVLKTDGPSGQSFSAFLTLDGLRREVSDVTPAEFPLECVVLVGEVTAFEGEGSFRFMIERQNGRGRFYTTSVESLRCFRYTFGTIGVVARK